MAAISGAAHASSNLVDRDELAKPAFKLPRIEQNATPAGLADGVELLRVDQLAQVFRFGQVAHDYCTQCQ